MSPISFSVVIKKHKINPYVHVSAAHATEIKEGWRKPLPVLVRVDGEPKKKPWRINMMPMGDGGFYLYLNGIVRRASGTDVGDTVHVEVAFNPSYRNGPLHRMPSSLRAALAQNHAAQKAWNDLIPSRKKEVLRYLAGLKTPEARERNIAKLMLVLSGKGGRYMARNW